MKKKAVLKEEKLSNNDKTCRCCDMVANTFMELGQDFNRFLQTSTIYLCETHAKELKDRIGKINS